MTAPAEPPIQPPARPTPKTPREVRMEREAAALRANLRKRKDQARTREEGASSEAAEADPAAAR